MVACIATQFIENIDVNIYKKLRSFSENQNHYCVGAGLHFNKKENSI